MCIDYRKLNAKTLNPDSYMLPRIDDTLDALNRAKFFCTLDIQQGYHNVELTESAKAKTAFHAPFCNPSHWEYVYMPFGLVRAPRTFQRLMDRILQGLDHKIALAYIDDIIVYGATMEEVLDNLSTVFGRLVDAGVKLKAKKCFLFQKETTYLGHVISSEGVKCDPIKVQAVQDWHAPKTVKQVRSFLGMVCYYNKFIKNYASVAKPLYDLLGKKKKWTWGPDNQQSFEDLRKALVSAPVLAYPSSEGRYILDTDASNFAYGAVLSQIQRDENGEDHERVIAYYSKTLSPSEQRYCARRRELLAILRAVKHFEVYLRGPEFIIRTDHASLQFIKTLTQVPDQMFRWILFLEQYSYKIVVRAGKEHANADTLSRIPCNGKICICEQVEAYEKRAKTKIGEVQDSEHSLPVTSVCAIKFMPRWSSEQIAQYQSEDSDLKKLYSAKQEGDERPHWNTYSGESPACKAYFAEWKRIELWGKVLYRRWESNDGKTQRMQLVVPKALQRMICREVHDGRNTCHMGKKRALKLLMKNFFWYKLDRDIAWWIRTCEVCQRRMRPKNTAKAPIKVDKTGYPGERVAMDVVGPLKESKNGNKYVLCITDHFSKYSRAEAMPNQLACTVAEIFVKRWVYDWGEPLTLHTDQGSNFNSDLMRQVCELLQIGKTRTSPYHPQGNAQNERYNQTVINIVAKLTDKQEYNNWDDVLPTAVCAYNSTEHAATGYTPNLLMTGREMHHNIDKMMPDRPVQDRQETLDQYVQRLDEETRLAYQTAREAIGKSVLIQKKYYDRTTHLNKYKVGDPIMLRNHAQYMQGEKKLADKYVGPYYVIDVLSDVNFRVNDKPDNTPKVVHHDRMKPIVQRDPPDLKWVFEQSRTCERQRAENKSTTSAEQMKEVFDRLKQLENESKQINKYRKRHDKNKKKAVIPLNVDDGPRDPSNSPKVQRKRGRPRKNLQTSPTRNSSDQRQLPVRRSARLQNQQQ